ncbi:MAG: phytanoyl-CoA dioxygenase family protein [Gammaproteobacteria bacterium]|nr:phytanoyl-CoA dioxygenase family protein [Gammaproteobacteria bacterium]
MHSDGKNNLSNNTAEQIDLDFDRFQRDGYLIVRQILPAATIGQLHQHIQEALDPPLAPVEFEADVHYPGSPESRLAPGGATPRRLLHVLSRHPDFRACAAAPAVVSRLQKLMGSKQLLVSQNHHNCVMTKHPGFSSVTSWHQDIRYWSFDRPELVSTWLALGEETRENGGLLVIPGSHREHIDRGRMDAALFLRTDLPENQSLIEQAKVVELQPGDMLFFHSTTFHAAGRNETGATKRSLVFTYRTIDNAPIPETRSAVYPDIVVS